MHLLLVFLAVLNGMGPVYVTDLTDGDYLYVNRQFDLALKGVPANGRMGSRQTNTADKELVYHISFTASKDTAFITHKLTNTPIGYDAKGMVAEPSPWLVYHDGDQTLFYAVIQKKNYILWLNVWDSSSQNESSYAGLLQTDPMASPMGLLPAADAQRIPDAYPASLSAPEYRFPLGEYELLIKNGQKQIRLR